MRIRILLAISALSLIGCASGNPSRPLLATSIYPLQFLASSIVGEHFEVVNITPPGAEPHDYELSVSAMKTISDSKAFFVNGYGMEAYSITQDSPYYQKTMVVGEKAEKEKVGDTIDPHFWLSTSNYKKMGEAILESVISLDKPNENVYRTNFASFVTKLEKLETKCQSLASSFKDKIIAVTHLAYGYMGNQWGFEQIGVNGLSPDVEPSQKDIEDMLDTISSRGIDTIFFEELASDEVASAIARQAQIKTDSLATLEYLTEEDSKKGEDYFSIYYANMEKIGKTKP